jgi:hypothetical protein
MNASGVLIGVLNRNLLNKIQPIRAMPCKPIYSTKQQQLTEKKMMRQLSVYILPPTSSTARKISESTQLGVKV